MLTSGASSALAPQVLDDLLLYRLSRVMRATSCLVVRLLEGEHGITRREWALLAALHGCEALTSSALADRLQLDRVRTSRGLQGLLAKALVQTRRDAQDGRKVWIALTESGQALYAKIFPQVAQINVELGAALAPDELAILWRSLDRLETQGRQLMQQGRVPGKANRSRRRAR
jgi:DNA-binding MarR family transcriptional regulator